ncbi:hypothetical protein PT974_00430 [Cladobotryum mycophilum]|uniref:Uncharacterized protein n=1 Tax=Cladobotryum mycophilum TaxID=491253 RepID=A0ABR0T1E9_9HYPO
MPPTLPTPLILRDYRSDKAEAAARALESISNPASKELGDHWPTEIASKSYSLPSSISRHVDFVTTNYPNCSTSRVEPTKKRSKFSTKPADAPKILWKPIWSPILTSNLACQLPILSLVTEIQVGDKLLRENLNTKLSVFDKLPRNRIRAVVNDGTCIDSKAGAANATQGYFSPNFPVSCP